MTGNREWGKVSGAFGSGERADAISRADMFSSRSYLGHTNYLPQVHGKKTLPLYNDKVKFPLSETGDTGLYETGRKV
jgi:hypothetical protein